MTDPVSATTIPRILGITSNGVSHTLMVATNLTTDETQTMALDSNKVGIIDAAEFTTGYTNGDIISFECMGASKGKATITINTATGFQETTLAATGALTVVVDI